MLALVLMLFFPMAVIDFCLTRTLVCDEDTNYQSLRLSWASKTSCDQRKGKAPEAELTEAPVVIRVFLRALLSCFRSSGTSCVGTGLCYCPSLVFSSVFQGQLLRNRLPLIISILCIFSVKF